jgi:hypothetical protein
MGNFQSCEMKSVKKWVDPGDQWMMKTVLKGMLSGAYLFAVVNPRG